MVQFNKMFVMLPLMFAVRKLDGEDPTTVKWIRVSYAVVQTICVLIVLYAYLKASSASKRYNQVVYVPQTTTPFADPNAKKKYTETTYGAHVLQTARSLLGSTLFGVALTLGLHYYKGMIMGLAIQSVMAPFNLAENAIVKALLIGEGIKPSLKLFDEKSANELDASDEVVDEQGNPVVRNIAEKEVGSTEEILLDTWDSGNKADLSRLMAHLNKKNCNYQTKEDHWTPLMILSGLGVKGTASAIRQVIDMGGNVAIVDKEGWTALHWASFHGSVEAATELSNNTNLLTVKDKEGLTPVEMARKEKNDKVAEIYEEAMKDSKKSK